MTLPDRFAQQARERAERAAAFRAAYLDDDVPRTVADDLFAYAYEAGHAYGWNEVESHYVDLADLVVRTFRAGREAAS